MGSACLFPKKATPPALSFEVLKIEVWLPLVYFQKKGKPRPLWVGEFLRLFLVTLFICCIVGCSGVITVTY